VLGYYCVALRAVSDNKFALARNFKLELETCTGD